MTELEIDVVAALEATIAGAQRSPLYADRLAGVRIRHIDDLRALPLTTRADLQRVGPHGTRAVPMDAVCHFGESSGTTGAANATWLTIGDFERPADAIRRRHADVFAPGRIILNRFPFMAAPAHLMQLVAQRGGGVSIPAGNINWDVPFPRTLDLAKTTGAHVLAGMPMEPTVLGEIARGRGEGPAADFALDAFFLGGSPLPPAVRRRFRRVWGEVRVIELYGSTETMLLGTSCARDTLHVEPGLAHCEVLDLATGAPVPIGGRGLLVVTTVGIEGSPLVRLDTGDVVERLAPCACGDPRAAIVVLGRAADAIDLGGRTIWPTELTEACAAAADALDSSVFFVVVLPDRLVVRIEAARGQPGDPVGAFYATLPGVPLEIERVERGMLLDIELLCRSPKVYKPVVTSDWRRPGRRIVGVVEGMIEWPRPSRDEGWRWIKRTFRNERRRRGLLKQLPVAPPVGR